MSNGRNERRPDIVIVVWERNPRNRRSSRRIVQATVIGSANPCGRLLDRNDRYSRARNCLLDNGFRRVFQQRSGNLGITIFIRRS